jgi:hypothetical protein
LLIQELIPHGLPSPSFSHNQPLHHHIHRGLRVPITVIPRTLVPNFVLDTHELPFAIMDVTQGYTNQF